MHKFDEMFAQLSSSGPLQFQAQSMGGQTQAQVQGVREHYRTYADWLTRQPQEVMRARREEAEMIFRRVGITFAVYGAKDEDGSGTERLIPFDLIPRIIPQQEWTRMEQGLVQRVTALNRFIHDVYHEQEIVRAGVLPPEQITGNSQFRPEMMGVNVPNNIYSHIAGIDIVRAPDSQGRGEYYVLEDNLRVPSGVSYMLEDRKMMMRLFPELFSAYQVAPVMHYPDLLLETLRASAPATTDDPTALAAFLAASVFYSVLSGFVAAWVARARPLLACSIDGVVLLGIGIAVQAGVWNRMPLWYHLTFLALLMPLTVLGGLLRTGRRRPSGTEMALEPARS